MKWNNVLGDIFPLLCGIQQEGVLPPVLFALYIDGVISELKLSGHGVHIGSLHCESKKTRHPTHVDNFAKN